MGHNGSKGPEPEKPEKIEAHEEQKKKKKDKDRLVEELQAAVAQKDEAIKGLEEKLLYLQAEFENFRKLKAREAQELVKYGNEKLLKELIPVVDNLDMALEHAAKSEDAKGIGEGIQLTLNQFLKVLEKEGVVRIDAVGARFDPNLHEAFFQEEREDLEADTVVSEFQKGYLLNGRLIRPSRVVVSKKAEEA